jgi:HEAT repeat protein
MRLHNLFLGAGVLVLCAATGWCDITLLRDQVLSTDPAVVERALHDVDALNSAEKQVLATGLIGALHQDAPSALAAIRALNHCSPEARGILPDLVSTLSFDEPEVSSAVGDLLLKVGPTSVPALSRVLYNDNFLVRQRAAVILAGFGPEARPAAPALVDLLQDNQFEVQTAAENALIKIGDPVVPVIADALRKNDPQGRKLLVTFLGKLGPAAAPVLVQVLRKDENPYVRVSAASVLAGFHPVDPSLVPALVEALKDPNDGVRTSAIDALGQLASDAKAAIGPLIVSAHRDSEALNAQKSRQALDAIGPGSKDSLPGLIQGMKDSDAGIRKAIVVALGDANMPTDEALTLLNVALNDSDELVQAQAIEVTGLLSRKDPKAIPVLRRALSDNNSAQIRSAAIKALGDSTSDVTAAVEALEHVILKEQDPAFREQCLEPLRKLGAPAVPVLLLELKDNYGLLAQGAEEAIVQIGSNAVPPLEKAMTSSDPMIQRRITIMIQRIKSAPPISVSTSTPTQP